MASKSTFFVIISTFRIIINVRNLKIFLIFSNQSRDNKLQKNTITESGICSKVFNGFSLYGLKQALETANLEICKHIFQKYDELFYKKSFTSGAYQVYLFIIC